LLNALLPDDIRCLERPDDQGRVLAQRGIPLAIEALSDGVKSFLAWMGDLLVRLDWMGARRIVDVEGIVVVDEIDQRMHPRWQQIVLPRLASTFPSLQFICSAHSPLLASALQRENLILVEPDPQFPGEGATKASRLTTEDVFGRSADQVLESSYFGLASTRSEPFWEELRAVAGRAQTKQGGRTAALEFMRRLTDPSRFGDR
jgi:predicted ATPase